MARKTTAQVKRRLVLTVPITLAIILATTFTSVLELKKIRSYEKEEIEYVEKENITKYSDVDVIEKGIEKVVDEISNKIKTKNVHLSFDLDVLNDDEFPAVNVLLHKTYVSGNGLSFDIVNKGLRLLFEKLNIVSMDIVEYNPLLDKDLECKKKIEILVDTIKNSIK